MIEYVKGDIFNSPAQVIVNPVNTVGVMGKGLALSFKQRYPEMFDSYKKICEKKQFFIGKLLLYYAPDHWVLLFPTKEHWRYPSKLEYIEKGLIKFVQQFAEKNITSIAFPKLGCGNGELNWKDVKPMMENYLNNLPIDVYIYLGYNDTAVLPEHKNPNKTMEWLKSNAKDMSFNGVKDDIIYQSEIIPIKFQYKNNIWEAKWENGLKLFSEKQNINISEDQFFEIWDDIRTKEIFLFSEDNTVNLVYYLLFSLKYLSPIMIEMKGTTDFMNGFQLNKGYGRMYSVGEIK